MTYYFDYNFKFASCLTNATLELIASWCYKVSLTGTQLLM